MTELREVRQRIQTTREIRKMTSALQMIAAVHLHRYRDQVAGSNRYTDRLRDLLQLAAACEGGLAHPLMAPAVDGPASLIVFGADRGLCGAFNAEIVRETMTFAKAHPALRLTVVGRVVARRLARRGFTDTRVLAQPKGAAAAEVVDGIVQDVCREFADGEVSAVHVLYQRFESAIVTVPVVDQVLPLRGMPGVSGAGTVSDAWRWFGIEPDPVTLADWLIPEWMNRLVHNAFLNSLLSEAAARQRAMSRASDNAETMIDELTMQFRRLRQESITEEMLELTGGTLA